MGKKRIDGMFMCGQKQQRSCLFFAIRMPNQLVEARSLGILLLSHTRRIPHSVCETRLFRKISLLCQRSTYGDWFRAPLPLRAKTAALHILSSLEAAGDDVLEAFLITPPFCHLKRRHCSFGFAIEIAKSEFLAGV
jgi:hypothetical protein